MIQIVPQQKACANANSDNCTNLPNDLYITYMPKGVDQGWVTFVWCCEINSFCIACMAVFGIVCAYTKGAVWLACAAAVGCGVCTSISSCDYCCYTTCEQDLTTRIAVPGGSTC
jgi:hypothetical protein